ncbi:MAG: hypothetical protein K2Y27_17820, partial [Xanthobacteraceae bacterium]|nr:hypothetical protein [Xanthobacteraceae bacterium]
MIPEWGQKTRAAGLPPEFFYSNCWSFSGESLPGLDPGCAAVRRGKRDPIKEARVAARCQSALPSRRPARRNFCGSTASPS